MIAGPAAAQGGSLKRSRASPRADHLGGSFTVLENGTFAGSRPEGLAPATHANALANASMMDAIYWSSSADAGGRRHRLRRHEDATTVARMGVSSYASYWTGPAEGERRQ